MPKTGETVNYTNLGALPRKIIQSIAFSTPDETADQLKISPDRIEAELREARKMTGARSDAMLVLKGVEAGEIKTEPRKVLEALDDRELKFLQAMPSASSSYDLAQSLGIKTGTIKNNLRRLRGKLGLDPRATHIEIVLAGVEAKLINLEDYLK